MIEIQTRISHRRNKYMSKKKSKYFKYLLWILASLTAMSLLLSYILDSEDNKWDDFFVNLGASFVIVVFTIFVVNRLLDERDKKRYKDAHDTAKRDIEILKNKLVICPGEILGLAIENDDYLLTELEMENSIKNVLEKLIKSNIEQILESHTTKDWERLERNFSSVKNSLSNIIMLYSNLVPPEILGKLLKVNQKTGDFFYEFDTFSSLFTKEKEGWLHNKLGQEYNMKIRNTLISRLSVKLENYFNAVEELQNSLIHWQK